MNVVDVGFISELNSSLVYNNIFTPSLVFFIFCNQLEFYEAQRVPFLQFEP